MNPIGTFAMQLQGSQRGQTRAPVEGYPPDEPQVGGDVRKRLVLLPSWPLWRRLCCAAQPRMPLKLAPMI